MFFCLPNGLADKNATIPNFNHVNQPNLDKIPKAEVFVHSDDQLRAAHIILGYTLLSSSFQAPKCVIKAKDPRLHLINVAVPSFLNLGPRPQGVLKVEPIFQCKVEDEATPSQLATTEGEEKEEKEKEKIVEVLDSKDESEDDFKVFN